MMKALRSELEALQTEIDIILGKYIVTKRKTKKPYNLLMGVQNKWL